LSDMAEFELQCMWRQCSTTAKLLRLLRW
jgi:hypothetical protein